MGLFRVFGVRGLGSRGQGFGIWVEFRLRGLWIVPSEAQERQDMKLTREFKKVKKEKIPAGQEEKYDGQRGRAGHHPHLDDKTA